MIAMQVESVASCWEEIYALSKMHHEGTQSYRRHEPFNPDRDRYIHYNDLGFFHLITARDGERLVGYFGVYVTKSMHSQLSLATEDTFFIHPDYRQGRLAVRYIRYIETYLATMGVHELMFSCEIDNTSGIQGLLNMLDYEPVILQHRKILSPVGKEGSHVRTVATSSPRL